MNTPHEIPLFLDTSALVRRYLADRDRSIVIDSMTPALVTESRSDPLWVASALAKTELQLALSQATPTRSAQRELWITIREDWDAIWEIPVDQRCLTRAAEIGAQYGLATVDAIHLAAADRLPRPARFLTFERQQIPAAADLGFQIISPFDRHAG